MKRRNRPWMLLYLLVGALVLSTGLNFYFLLQLDNRVWDQEITHEFPDHTPDSPAVTLRLPEPAAEVPDTTAAPQP